MKGTRKPKRIQLSPPRAPEMVVLRPADPNYHGGVSIADGTAEAGFKFLMLAYLNQAEDDLITLYLDDYFFVADTTVKKGEEHLDIPLMMPRGTLHSDLNIFRFGITRFPQDEVFTPPLNLLYRNVPPGGTPPVFTLKSSHTSVGPDEADKFILTVTYDKIHWYDVIHVDCAGQPVRHQLLPEITSPLPPVHASIDIPIPRSVFEQAGDSSAFKFTLRVADYLTNSSTASPPLTIDVHLQRRQLPMAVLREDLADNSDNPAEVDLGKMNGGPLWALLYLADTIWQPQDSIHLKFTSVVSGTATDYEETLSKKELPTQFNWKIPNANVKPDSDVEMFYEQIQDGKVIGRSITAVAKVIGEPTIEPPPPTLAPPAVSPIAVLAYPNGVKLQVKDFIPQEGDKAQFVQVNAPAGAPPFPAVDFIDGIAEISLSAAFLAACHRKTIDFQWTLIRAGQPAGQSATAKFDVMEIADGDPRLPTPNIADVIDEILKVNNLEDDARIHIARWLPIAPGQKVWLLLSGTNNQGELYDRVIYDGVNVVSSDLNGLYPLAPVEELCALQDGSELKLIVKINFQGNTNEDDAVTTPIRKYVIMASPKLCIDTSTMILDGRNVILSNPPYGWLRSADPLGSMDRRQACGGTPTYTYLSENSSIASVDDNGFVRSNGNGDTSILVTDATGSTVKFDVKCTNVWNLTVSTQKFQDIQAAAAWITSEDGTQLDYDVLLHHEIVDLTNKCYTIEEKNTAFFTGNSSSNYKALVVFSNAYNKIPNLQFITGYATPLPWPALYIAKTH